MRVFLTVTCNQVTNQVQPDLLDASEYDIIFKTEQVQYSTVQVVHSSVQ